MRSRAAIFLEPGKPLVVDEVEYPDQPGPGEVLVRNFASGICHSQLHQMHGPRAITGPVLLGHEATSEVVAVGPGVTHVKPGDMAFVTWIARDAQPGEGMPKPPESPVLWRGQNVVRNVFTWAEHTLARESLVVKAPADVPRDVSSVIGCAVMTGSGAVINTADVQRGQSAAVFGVGGVGMSAIVALAVREADPIIAVDLSDEKLEFAKKFGATVTINAAQTDPVEEIARITGPGTTDLMGKPRSGLDFAFDCIGKEITIRQILEAVRPADISINRGGMAVLVGVPDGDATINALDLLRGEKFLTSSYGGSCRPDRDFPEFARWVKEGQLDLDALVTERIKLDDINEGCERLRTGKVFGRSIIEF